MSTIKFTAFGKPQTAGSKRAFPFKRRDGSLGVAVSDDNPNGKAWQSIVADAARAAYSGPLLEGPLRAEFTFYFARPKGHYRSGKNGHLLKETAPDHHASKPDALKLARCAEDSLSNVLYRDDAQICSEILVKAYGEPPRCEVRIVTLPVEIVPTDTTTTCITSRSTEYDLR